MFSFALRLHKKGVSSHLLNLAPLLIISLDNGIMMTLKWPVDLNLSVMYYMYNRYFLTCVRILHYNAIFAHHLNKFIIAGV